MTGDTTGIMIAIQCKIFSVVECRRQPFFLGVALRTIAGNLLMERIGRRLVTILALSNRILSQVRYD